MDDAEKLKVLLLINKTEIPFTAHVLAARLGCNYYTAFHKLKIMAICGLLKEFKASNRKLIFRVDQKGSLLLKEYALKLAKEEQEDEEQQS